MHKAHCKGERKMRSRIIAWRLIEDKEMMSSLSFTVWESGSDVINILAAKHLDKKTDE